MDLVTFGEAMLRLTPPAFQRLEQARALDVHVGGTELNVAVAAARLGVPTRWVSRLSDNPLGRMIADRAREQGVDVHVDWSTQDRVGLYFTETGAPPRPTNVVYDRVGSAIAKITPGVIDWPSVFGDARWFHVSGITPALSESAARVTAEALAAAKTAGLTVSYDLNYRSKLWSPESARAAQEPLMSQVDLLTTTENDARVVFGLAGETREQSDSFDPGWYEQAARTLQQRFGIHVVAVTVGEHGRSLANGCSAVVAAAGAMHHAPRFEVEVVDRIGAGDAFAAGLIVSALESRGWEDAVRFAAAMSALKLTIPGDFCLVTRAEVEQLARGPSVRVSR